MCESNIISCYLTVENLVTLAAVSGRTLVLPPDQVVYLLDARKGDKRRGRNYYDFFNITSNSGLLRRVPIITSEEFLKIEGGTDGYAALANYNTTWQNHLWSITKWCEERRKSDVFCEDLYDHYRVHGLLQPVRGESPGENCFIFDEQVFDKGVSHVPNLSPDSKKRIMRFCNKRVPVFYNRTMHDAPIWHFETMDLQWRLLVHYYSLILFTDPKVQNYYRRFVRDFMRYHDEVFCAAGKIILALQYEDYTRNIAPSGGKSLQLDSELVGGFSSLHIRRGDLQFKEVKFDSNLW